MKERGGKREGMKGRGRKRMEKGENGESGRENGRGSKRRIKGEEDGEEFGERRKRRRERLEKEKVVMERERKNMREHASLNGRIWRKKNKKQKQSYSASWKKVF